MMLVHLIVSGRVQGVGFRYSAQEKARAYGLVGWVQNKADGTVEIEVEGEEKAIVNFINEIKSGLNHFIRVDNIEISKSDKIIGYRQFRIK